MASRAEIDGVRYGRFPIGQLASAPIGRVESLVLYSFGGSPFSHDTSSGDVLQASGNQSPPIFVHTQTRLSRPWSTIHRLLEFGVHRMRVWRLKVAS